MKCCGLSYLNSCRLLGAFCLALCRSGGVLQHQIILIESAQQGFYLLPAMGCEILAPTAGNEGSFSTQCCHQQLPVQDGCVVHLW